MPFELLTDICFGPRTGRRSTRTSFNEGIMLGKIARTAILLLLGIIIVLFLVANRHVATISVDPFNSADPAFAAPVPLGVLMLLPLILGVIIGGTAAWLRQGKWRRTARRLDRENRALHAELYDLKRYYASNERPTGPPRVDSPPLALRSAVH
jgi:uncharacterized integral membrane protein